MAKNYEKAALLFTETIGEYTETMEEDYCENVVGNYYDEIFKTEAESMNSALTKLCSIEQRWRWIVDVYGPENAWVVRNEGGYDGLPFITLETKDGDKWCLRKVYVVGVE